MVYAAVYTDPYITESEKAKVYFLTPGFFLAAVRLRPLLSSLVTDFDMILDLQTTKLLWGRSD